MSTIVELQKRAAELKAKYQRESITPEEVGQLHEDTLQYIADLERHVDNLGVRKVYAGKADMDADTAPVGTNGKAMKYGQLAVIRSTDADNGNIYAWQKPGWLLIGNLNEGQVVNDLVSGGSNVPLSAEQGKVLGRKIEAVVSSIPAVVDNLSSDDVSKALSAKQGKALFEMANEYDVSAHNGGNVYTLAGTAQVVRLTVTTAPTANGDVTITLGGKATTVTLTAATQTTPALVAAQIAAATYAGYTVTYTAGNAYVDFGAVAIGDKAVPVLAVGSTGAVGSVAVTTIGSESAIATVPAEFQRGGMTIAFVDAANGQYIKYFCNGSAWSTDAKLWTNQNVIDSKNVIYGKTNVSDALKGISLKRRKEYGITSARAANGFYYSTEKKFHPLSGYTASELIAVPNGATSIGYNYLNTIYNTSLIAFDKNGNWLRVIASDSSGIVNIPSDCAFVGFNIKGNDTSPYSYIRFIYEDVTMQENIDNNYNQLLISLAKSIGITLSRSIFPYLSKYEYYFNETGIHYLASLNSTLNIFSVSEGEVVCLHSGFTIQYSSIYCAFFEDEELTKMIGEYTHISDVPTDGWGDTIYLSQDRIFWYVVPKGARYFAVNDGGKRISGSVQANVSSLYSYDVINFKSKGRKIDCYGDSLTAMTGYPQRLQKNLWSYGYNYKVNPYGVSGQGAEGVLKRLGSIPVYVKNKVTIPTSGNVTIVTDIDVAMQSASTLINLQNGDRNINPCIINGIEGVLSEETLIDGNSYSYTFTRSKDGDAVTVPALTQVYFKSMYEGQPDVTIIYVGTNNRLDKSTDVLISNIEAATQYVRNGKYLVVGLHVYNGTWMKFDIQYLKDFNQKLKEKFREHYVDVSGYMSQCGLDEAGITATDEDSVEIAKGAMPVSLMISDKTHFNESGFNVLGDLIFKKLVGLGYVEK